VSYILISKHKNRTKSFLRVGFVSSVILRFNYSITSIDFKWLFSSEGKKSVETLILVVP
jgi:hypothetical protein